MENLTVDEKVIAYIEGFIYICHALAQATDIFVHKHYCEPKRYRDGIRYGHNVPARGGAEKSGTLTERAECQHRGRAAETISVQVHRQEHICQDMRCKTGPGVHSTEGNGHEARGAGQQETEGMGLRWQR